MLSSTVLNVRFSISVAFLVSNTCSGHYHAYRTGKVLHRDLSETNLMFKRDANGRVKGILNDWDMASLLDDKGQVPFCLERLRTGTAAFMADELSAHKEECPHLYRHDLESFLYILAWASVHFDIRNKQRLPVEYPILQHWNTGTYKLLTFTAGWKTEFEGHVLEEWRGVLNEWIRPLGMLFTRELYMTGYSCGETRAGRLTFETFMATIGRTPCL
jgi:hypothetical protein